MSLFRYSIPATALRTTLTLLLALLVAAAAAAQAQNPKKKGRKGRAGQTQTAQQTQAPPPAQPAQNASSGAVDPTLRRVDAKLLAYATSAARTELGALASDQSPGPLTALGRIYEQEKNYAEAARCLQKAGQLAPNDPAPWAYLGEAYLHQKRQSEAAGAFREVEKRAQAAVAKNASDAEAHYFLGLARLHLGQTGAALASLGKAHQLDPHDPLALYQMGLAKAFEQKWQESVDRFTQALELNANLAYAYFYRGQSASKLNRKDLLIADLEKFLELAPNAPEAPIAQRTIAAARR